MSVTAANNYSVIQVFGMGLHRVPVFQRNYSWRTKQVSALWADLQEAAFPGGYPGHIASHYLGAMVEVAAGQGGALNEYEVVDGQQRLATVALALSAVLTAASRPRVSVSAASIAAHQQNVAALLHAPAVPGQPSPTLKVVMNSHDNAFFEGLILGTSPTPSVPSHRRIKSAHSLFVREMTKHALEMAQKGVSGDVYFDTLYKAIWNMSLTRIEVSNIRTAFRVFESLNGKGLDLSAADLVKNTILSRVDATGGNVDAAAAQWDSLCSSVGDERVTKFLRHYFCSVLGAPVRADDILDKVTAKLDTGIAPLQLLSDLDAEGARYGKLVCPMAPTAFMKQQSRRDKLLGKLSVLSVEQPYILLLACDSKLSQTDFESVLERLVVFTFRYSTIGDNNPNELERLYSDWASRIRSDAMTAAELIGELDKKLPSDQEFNAAFAAFTTKRNILGRYIIAEVEYYLSSTSKVIDLEDVTLEHVIPQKVNTSSWFTVASPGKDELEEVIYSVGNFALLPQGWNSAIGNKDYASKWTFYTSPQPNTTNPQLNNIVPATSYDHLSDLTTKYPRQFEAAEVNQRASALASLAEKIWA